MTKRARLMDSEPPRLMSEAETAHHLAMSVSEFSRQAGTLERDLGMPKRHPVLKRRDRVAIDHWLNRVFGIGARATKVSELVRQRMGELRGDGNRAH
jgi:hypothetical protein